jgi:hypothetical protein
MNQKNSSTAVLIACLLIAQQSGVAAGKPLELKWNELSPLIAGRIVELVVPGGATVRGEVAAVREDALVLDVRQSSDAKAYPKGNAAIPRTSVMLLQVQRERGKWGRSIGTTLGVITGLGLGGYTAAKTADSAGAGVAIVVAIAGAGAVGGYFAGTALDHKTTEIRVIP